MSYVLAFTGFAVLIILHEAGHFAAAKAVGMRVEKFSLFFGKLLVSFKRGETEYGIGWLPAGGYVKITGMNPHEELTPELEARAYYNQPPWKRIVVILAGPFVNLVIAFVILFAIFSTQQEAVLRHGNPIPTVALVQAGSPATGALRAGDVIVAVDGQRNPTFTQVHDGIGSHRCRGVQTNGCIAATPVMVTLRRAGRLVTVRVYPRYNTQAKRMLVGFDMGYVTRNVGVGIGTAADNSVDAMWSVTSTTVSKIARLFQASQRRQVHGIAYGFTVVERQFGFSTREALGTLGLISLSLAVVNLFPFLPLDGGHVFWAVAEKLRGRRISFDVMERAGVVGFLLIIMLFVIGLSNDISTLSSKGFNVH
jgi:regulator of sigma E protease